MRSKLAKLFIPQSTQNEEDKRMASQLMASALITLVVTPLLIGSSLLFFPLYYVVVLIPFAIGFMLLAGIVLILLKKQQLLFARFLFAVGSWVNMMVMAILLGGVRNPVFTALLPLAVLTAGYIGGPKLSFGLGTCSVVIGGLIVWYESLGNTIEILPALDTSLIYLLTTLPALILIPVVTLLSERSFRSLLQRTRDAEAQKYQAEITELRNTQLETTIREQQRVEDALIAAKEAAESAEQAKSQFLANMSHEIRTPMNGVIGMTSLVLEKELDDDVRDSLETIRSSGDALITIINDILDYSKIEYGGIQLDPQPMNLAAHIDSIISVVTPRANEKQISIKTHILNTVPTTILIDSVRLGQILTNLLSNAIKFTLEGQIELTVSNKTVEIDRLPPNRYAGVTVSQSDENSPHKNIQVLHFAVRDTGIGIASDKLALLFKPFSQVDASTTRRFGGTGLGLMISYRLAELMGGRMWVESTEDVGSTFHFTILTQPAAAVTAVERIDKESKQATIYGKTHPLKILLAEDNLVNQKVAKQMLKTLAYQVEIVNNGKEAIDLLQQQQYDLVLMDIHMPEMDGLEATRQIHRLIPVADRPRIVAMTASAMQEDQDKTKAAGMDGFITKPIRKSELIEILESTPAKHEDSMPQSV